jgi:hypothetical protein
MRRSMSVIALLCSWALWPSAAAYAQIAGIPVSCRDFRGVPVALVPDPTLPDVGAARIVNNQPVIFMNPAVLNVQAPAMQLFWYAHECGHHALGHMVNLNQMSEAQADCWAVRTGRSQGWFPPQAFQLLIATLGNSPGDFWGHLPGPARIRNMAACYSQ